MVRSGRIRAAGYLAAYVGLGAPWGSAITLPQKFAGDTSRTRESIPPWTRPQSGAFHIVEPAGGLWVSICASSSCRPPTRTFLTLIPGVLNFFLHWGAGPVSGVTLLCNLCRLGELWKLLPAVAPSCPRRGASRRWPDAPPLAGLVYGDLLGRVRHATWGQYRLIALGVVSLEYDRISVI